MPIESMTGFARHDANVAGVSIVWELKSVNGKSLDIRLRLPAGWERIEQAVRQKFQSQLARGNVQANLALDEGKTVTKLVINETLLRDVEDIASKLGSRLNLAPPSIVELLSIRGLLEQGEGAASEVLEPAIMACLDQALHALKKSRQSEGLALEAILRAQVESVGHLTAQAENDPSRQPEAIQNRIVENIAALIGASPVLDESRLASEALFVANRADIREEIDRLKTHVASARKLLDAGGAVGRKLDFLAQEFNRESNTLCSKSNAASITTIGLELKSVVDQFREQVQNLE